IDVRWSSQVGDRLADIVRQLQRAWDDATVIITTGGIGPTADDLTREAIAALLDETPTVDPDALETLRGFFAARGQTMPEQNIKQAWRIPSAELLPNPLGTAPGWFVRRDNHVIVTMPGVPREMIRMWRAEALPRLLPYCGGQTIRMHTLKTIGLGESAVEERLMDLVARPNPIVATYAKDDGVHVRITARAANADEAERLLEATAEEVRRRLGRHVYGTEETSLAGAALEPLRMCGWTLAVEEHGSGGRVAALLSDAPDAATTLRWAIVKPDIQEVTGEALQAVAHAASVTVRQMAGTDCGLGVALAFPSADREARVRGSVALALTTPAGEFRQEQSITAPLGELRRRAGLWSAELLHLAGIDLLEQSQE
ncbi:MAG: competence/damage-inducible protein A, partial [Thermorudis peleae]|nr:competence/damage-inducible protein A [Thermorudis peleae]